MLQKRNDFITSGLKSAWFRDSVRCPTLDNVFVLADIGDAGHSGVGESFRASCVERRNPAPHHE
jgi:hypothetical protein